LRIAIVGADSRAWAKIPDGEIKVKEKIKWIINQYASDTLCHGPFEDIILVSGHCPIGQERWYCVDCAETPAFNPWSDKPCELCGHHRTLKVYDQGGVDTWAEIIATELGLKKEIYPAICATPKYKGEYYEQCVKRFDDYWKKEGFEKADRGDLGSHLWEWHFKPRNIQIAEAGLEDRKFFCKECLDKKWNSLEMMLKEHPTLKNYPELCGTIDDFVLYDIEPAGSCKHCLGLRFKIPVFVDRPDVKGIEMPLYRDKQDAYNLPEKCRFCESDGAYSGGTWTLKYARKLGREVHKIIIK